MNRGLVAVFSSSWFLEPWSWRVGGGVCLGVGVGGGWWVVGGGVCVCVCVCVGGGGTTRHMNPGQGVLSCNEKLLPIPLYSHQYLGLILSYIYILYMD